MRSKLAAACAAVVLLIMFGATPSLAQRPFALHVPVLMYHRIMCQPPATRPSGLYVCPDRFDRELALLEQEGWRTITADALATDLDTRTCPPAKTFVISIDDGTLDGYTVAAPLLEAHRFRATFAIVVGEMGGTSSDPGGTHPHFDWDQARDLVARGHGIADHTMHHTRVSGMSVSQLEAAVGQAQQTIHDELGFAPSVFVYPYGTVGGKRVTAYLAARFALALTTQPGAFESSTDPLHAPRIGVIGRRGPGWVLRALDSFAQPCR